LQTRQGRVERVPESKNDQEGGQRLPDVDDGNDCQYLKGMLREHAGVEEHADGHEEKYGKGFAEWQRFLGGTMTQGRFSHDHTRNESAEGEGSFPVGPHSSDIFIL
jgi:hypothetical protein